MYSVTESGQIIDSTLGQRIQHLVLSTMVEVSQAKMTFYTTTVRCNDGVTNPAAAVPSLCNE